MRDPRLTVPLLMLFACGGLKNTTSDGGPGSSSGGPTVSSTAPANGASATAVNLPITATFSQPMEASTLNSATFLLKQGSNEVPGVVTYAGQTATLTPTSVLVPGAVLTATVTAGSTNTAGVPLVADYSWSFTTVAAGAPPTVSATKPLNAATNVWTGLQISASFNEEMNPATLNAASFTLLQGSTSIAGTVSYDAATNTAAFSLTAPLGGSLPYVATISKGATNTAGLSLPEAYSWAFTTRPESPAALPVSLGTAGHYAILAKTAISTVPISAITGDIALSPAAATYITGFSLIADSSGTFSTSSQVSGKVYAADYATPTASDLTTAVTDMETALTDAVGREPDITELGAGNIGGMTLFPGVYHWASGLLIPTDVTLAGGPTDVWIFDVAQNLTAASGAHVVLSGGALASHVFWQVSGLVDLGTTVQFEGILLSQTSITLQTGASITGRLLAQSAVSLNGNTVVEPAP